MNIKAVIFDLDGVIVSTDECHYLAWKKIADEEGIYFDRTINERLRGVSRMESLDIVLEKAEKEAERVSPKAAEKELDIICEKCGTRYSVIGAAYFCPCCGYNSVSNVFDESLDSIEKMLKSIPDMREWYLGRKCRENQ